MASQVIDSFIDRRRLKKVAKVESTQVCVGDDDDDEEEVDEVEGVFNCPVCSALFSRLAYILSVC